MAKVLVAMMLGCGLVLAGCATVGTRQDAKPRVAATFDDHGMTAQDVSLLRDASSIRGNAYGRPVSIEWDGAGVRGSYRNLPVKFAVSRAGDTVQVEGEFYGEAAEFQYAPDRLEGFLSGCAFLLVESGGRGRLEGHRACVSRKAEALTIVVPEQLARRSEVERAAWLALFITDETVEVPFVRAQFIQSAGHMRRPRPGIGCGRMGP